MPASGRWSPSQLRKFFLIQGAPGSDRFGPPDGLPRFVFEMGAASIPAWQTSDGSVQERRSDQDHRDDDGGNRQHN